MANHSSVPAPPDGDASASGSTEPPEAGLPLSARQSLLWLDERLFPDARYNNLVLTIELTGALDVPRLSRAWAQTVADRDALRLQLDPRQARQRFSESGPTSLPLVALDAEKLDGWLGERCQRPLAEEPFPWEAVLLRLAPRRHVFYLCQHQIASDPASLWLLAQHLATRYSGSVPPPAPSFREYLEHEAAYRGSAQGAEDQAFWSRKLSVGAPPLRPYGIARSDRSVGLTRAWLEPSEERARRLEAVAQREPFATGDPWSSRLLLLATGTAAFLYRVTGNREILLGLPVPNRSARFAGTCGLLMEQVFLRVAIGEGDTFESLGRTIGEELTQALRHGRACLGPHGLEYVSLSFLPAFPVQFAELEATPRVESCATLARGDREGDLRDTLGLTAFDFAGGAWPVALDLHRATFDQRTRHRAGAHLLRVLDALAQDPRTAIDSIDLLTAEERRTVLQAGRGPQPGRTAPDFLDRFAEQVRRRPHHPAVVGPDATLSYAELEERSGQLARRLRALGVGRESRVGVALPRGARELTTFLATLKAGGAYVPVDLSHPLERIRLILDDAAPQVLVSQSGSPLAEALPAGTALLALDDLTRCGEGCAPVALPEEHAPDQLAYILFTSGSTGRPKGVEVLRGGIANFLQSVAVTPGLSEDDRWLAIATTTFDMSTMDLYLPLSVGATLVLADRETATDPNRLRRRLEADPITVLQATPAMWRLLIDAGWTGSERLRMFAGGEALSADLASQLLDRGAELWNLYGPTETTVYSTVERVARGQRRVLVGRPIDQTQIYVLDTARQPVPVGVVGEIHIGGAGLARGYCRRPHLTTERFIPNPFGPPGERLYRTGDLGRLLDDGRFECLGRIDHQVKIRGFRIELGEIESALRGVPGVQDTVVIADDRGGGDPRLVAYWVGDAEQPALFDRARRQLPAYMVPSAYVRLESFPLTHSGKVDRQALPLPETAVPARLEGRRPSNDAEAHMAAIWSDVLGIAPIGVDQDFFALGGSSVKVIQARARIEQAFGVELPLRAFFETPTIEALVRQLGNAGSPDDPIVVHLRRGRAGTPPLFCLVGVQLYQDLAMAMEGDWPVISMHVPFLGVPGKDAPPTLPQVARRYVELIRREQPGGPYHLAGLCFGGFVAFEVARQLEAAGESVPVVAVFDGHFPGAIRIDRLQRWKTLLFRVLSNPLSIPGRLRAKAARLWARRPARWRQVRAAPGSPRQEDLINPLLDDDSVLAEMQRYGSLASPIHSRLVLFRALEPPLPAGACMDPDMGWRPLAHSVSAHEVASDHLGIVRDPHARRVAHVIAEALNAGPPAVDPAARGPR